MGLKIENESRWLNAISLLCTRAHLDKLIKLHFIEKCLYFLKCYFKENAITEIDYKDVKLLKRFVTDQGKIMPRRVTGTSAKMHRKMVRAIKRARNIALMPYTNTSTES